MSNTQSNAHFVTALVPTVAKLVTPTAAKDHQKPILIYVYFTLRQAFGVLNEAILSAPYLGPRSPAIRWFITESDFLRK